MNKKITLLIALSIFSAMTFGQNNTKLPTLQQIESYCLLKSNDDFSRVAKSFGFAFEAKYPQSYGMDYIFIRQTSINGTVKTERLIYMDFTIYKAVGIQIVTNIKDLGELYRQRIDSLYKPIDCIDTSKSNELRKCYLNNSNVGLYLSILDTRKQFSDGTTGNQYTLKIISNEK